MNTSETGNVLEEQLIYANLLEKGMYCGLAALVVTFVVYLSGMMQPAVPLVEIANYWNQDVHSYLVAINTNFLQQPDLPTGWAWLGLLHRSDFLNFIGIAALSGVSIFCYLAVVPVFLRKGDKAYAIMAVAEVLILVLAASGVVGGGAH